MKKISILLIVALTSAVACARGPGGPGFRPGPAPHHGGSFWGRGGSHFWPGFVGGAVGGLVAGAFARPPVVVAPAPVVPVPVVAPQPVVVTPPVVVQQPVVVQTAPAYQTQNVWVEGRYVQTVQSNGTVVQTWQPGHYETRTVLVQ